MGPGAKPETCLEVHAGERESPENPVVVERAVAVGHSAGGRNVAVTIAAAVADCAVDLERTVRSALRVELEPSHQVPVDLVRPRKPDCCHLGPSSSAAQEDAEPDPVARQPLVPFEPRLC